MLRLSLHDSKSAVEEEYNFDKNTIVVKVKNFVFKIY